MAVLDITADFIELTVSGLYDADDTAIDIDPGDVHYAGTPDPATTTQFNMLMFDSTVYGGRPWDDPNKEWVRVTAKNAVTPRLTVLRGQEGTAASTKNTAGSTYKLILAKGKKFRDDLEAAMVDLGVAYAFVTMYGAVGDGSTDDYAAFAAAVTAGVKHLVVPTGSFRLGTSWTAGTDMTVECHQGGMFDPDSGKTVTINGGFIAGNYRVKDATAAGDVVFGSRVTVKNPRWLADSDEPGQESVTSVKLSTVLKITPRSSAPSSPAAGDITVADRANWDPASLGDGGAYPAVYDGSAWKPLFPFKVVESGNIDCEAGGGKTCVIAHGLSYTPSAKDIMTCAYKNAGTGVVMIRTLSITSIDATNITLYWYNIAAQTSTGTTGRAVCWIRI